MRRYSALRHQKGAVLIFALVVLVAAAVTIGGIAQFAATRSWVGSREWEEASERINIGNSRAMAREALYSIIFLTNAPTNVIEATNSDLRCGFAMTNTIADYWTDRPPPASSAVMAINPFNPLERGGFYGATIGGALWNGSTNTITNTDGSTNANAMALVFQQWVFQVRLRSPVAAGFAFVRHAPAVPVLGEQLPEFRLDFTADTNPARWVTNAYQSVPVPRLQAGESGNGELSFFLPISGTGTVASETNDGTLTVYLADNTGATNSILFYDVPPADINDVAITNLIVVGDPSRVDPPVLLRIPAGNTNVSKLVLSGDNNRRLSVIREADGLPTFAVETTGAEWTHLALAVSRGNVPFSEVVFSHNNPIRITGGVVTDAQVRNMTTNIEPDLDPAGLDAIGNVVMWLEDHRVPLSE